MPVSNAACAASAKPASAVAPLRRIGRRIAPVPAAARRGVRAERRDGRIAAGRGHALRVARQRLLQGAHDRGTHQPGIAEAHLGLGRMHVHVDLARLDRDEQRHHRMAVARQIVRVGAAHRAEQQPVAHRAAVDEQILRERIALRVSRQRRVTLDGQALASAAHLDGICPEVGAQHIAEPREPPRGPGQRRPPRDGAALLAREREGDIRPAHGEAAHHVADRLGLGAVGLEKFQPRGRCVEQVAHLDARALRQRRRLHVGFFAGIDLDRPGVRLAGVTRRDQEPRDRPDGGQRLAAEAERVDRQQIVVRQFRCGVALDCQRQIRARHAGAVIGDANEPPPAAVGDDLDAPRACIERVFDKLLHDARRTLDHLAGGDAVDDVLGELADGHRATQAAFDARYLARHSMDYGGVALVIPANPMPASFAVSP